MAYGEQGTIGALEEHATGIFSISEISSVISSILDDARLQDIWVRGEVTNFRPHVSGHRYFSLGERVQNGGAVLHCVMWRNDARRIGGEFRDGMDVIAFGSITHYAPQGKYQFMVRDLRHTGEGEKHLLVERWKSELAAEGLFSEDEEETAPPLPTKNWGRDLRNRRGAEGYPQCHCAAISGSRTIVSPTAVQGELAHCEIVSALARI